MGKGGWAKRTNDDGEAGSRWQPILMLREQHVLVLASDQERAYVWTTVVVPWLSNQTEHEALRPDLRSSLGDRPLGFLS